MEDWCLNDHILEILSHSCWTSDWLHWSPRPLPSWHSVAQDRLVRLVTQVQQHHHEQQHLFLSSINGLRQNQIIGLTKINGNCFWHRSSNIISTSSRCIFIPLATFAGEHVPSDECFPSLIALNWSLDSGHLTLETLKNERVVNAGWSMPCHVLNWSERFFILPFILSSSYKWMVASCKWKQNLLKWKYSIML